MKHPPQKRSEIGAVIIGGGPAGLMAAETLLDGGVPVQLFDAMPVLARKLFVAGQSGLNLTSSEPLESFIERYYGRTSEMHPFLKRFGPQQVINWARDLGIATFTGSSGKLFPKEMTAGRLIESWLKRLFDKGLTVHTSWIWRGWDKLNHLCFHKDDEEITVAADCCIFALGGGSWPQLGSTGYWCEFFRAKELEVAPLLPANCGFSLHFSEHFLSRFHRHPLKNIAVSCPTAEGTTFCRRGECMISEHGLEGGLIYACAHFLRNTLLRCGQAQLVIDLLPDISREKMLNKLRSQPRGSRSLSTYLEKLFGLKGVKRGLIFEYLPKNISSDPEQLVSHIKSLELTVTGIAPLEKAISSAGGVCFSELDEHLMLRKLPGHFCAGEMLDWEAPTGGYLLTACLSTGRAAGEGALAWLQGK